MKRSIKAGFLQFDVRRRREENLQYIAHAMESFDGDLLVLPELSVCGYLFDSRRELLKIAECVPDGESVQRMRKLSKEHVCTVVFGLAERENDRVYNTAAVVKNGEYLGKYRKIHLSDLEKTLFDRGTCNGVIDAGAFRLGVQICFDLWFPEVSREQIAQGAEILCVPANFGGETSSLIARTRATENLTPLVLCNRVGTEKSKALDAYFLGRSTVWDASGAPACAAEVDCEVLHTGWISVGETRSNVICRDFDAEIAMHKI